MIFLRIFENVLAGQPAEQLDMGPGRPISSWNQDAGTGPLSHCRTWVNAVTGPLSHF